MRVLDLELPDAPNNYLADICVVGAGPAGVTITRELIGSGLKVILVESGGLTEESETHALYDGDTIGHLLRMQEGRHRVFGGSATKWGGRCGLLDPIDFERRDWLSISGWPFGYHDLVPYYERAKKCSNFEGYWLTDEIAIEQLKTPLCQFTGGKLQRMVWRVASPERVPTLRTRLKLGYRTHFDYGKAYLADMEASQTTQILLHANLIRTHVAPDGRRVEKITVATTKNRFATVQASHFVLATSGIENARLLLLAPEPLLRRANAHDNIGRFLSQHPRGNIGNIIATRDQARRLQETFNRFLQPPRVPVQYEVGFALTDTAQREHKLVNASAALLYSAGDDTPWQSARRLVNALKQRQAYRGAVGDLASLILGAPQIGGNVVRRYLLGTHPRHAMPSIQVELDLEQAPNADSRILLSFRRDQFDNRLACADWRIQSPERRTARFFADALDDEIRRMDLGFFKGKPWLYNDEPLTNEDLSGNYHFIGTTRMDADPARGVVDAECRVHGTENLYCAGASVFATGGHVNPTLTIVALAIRLADHLKYVSLIRQV